ncbi:hypothetical protein SO802_027118 [Lithocarpus litseifolius]|uniref:Reverse transcriptase n=1 Tax=Lithocarpus litseifolius TaxID=425828 RepID=A0AAW2C3N7_9ROSI
MSLSEELGQILGLEEELRGIKARTDWLIQELSRFATPLSQTSFLFRAIVSLIQKLLIWLPISDAEILFALNSMKAFKAPGPDGLCASFFQRFWMVVGDSVKFEVKQNEAPYALPRFSLLNSLHLKPKSKSQGNTEAANEVLDEFCSLTGQKISLAKSKIFFFANSLKKDKERVVQHLGIAETSNLGKYLGFPILHNGRRRNEFQFVVERVQFKLAGWESKCLSPAGKLVLLKAAISPIPEYFMQCCKLSTKVCDDMDRLVRDFLWGSTTDKKKIHLVGWNKVTNPKELGGLGIFQAKARNSALLAKLCWRIASGPDKPWAQMLVSKYLTPARIGEGGRKLPASRI